MQGLILLSGHSSRLWTAAHGTPWLRGLIRLLRRCPVRKLLPLSTISASTWQRTQHPKKAGFLPAARTRPKQGVVRHFGDFHNSSLIRLCIQGIHLGSCTHLGLDPKSRTLSIGQISFPPITVCVFLVIGGAKGVPKYCIQEEMYRGEQIEGSCQKMYPEGGC